MRNDSVKVLPALSSCDFLEVAKLHKQQLKAGVLAHMSLKFLSVFYGFIASNPQHGVLFVVKNDQDTVLGFICGSFCLKPLYVEFLKRHYFLSFFACLKILIQPKYWRRILSIKQYLSNPATLAGDIDAELLSIAVSSDCTGNGFGKKLFESLVDHFKQQSIFSFKVSAAHTQEVAQEFYRSLGGQLIGTTEIGLLETSVYRFSII